MRVRLRLSLEAMAIGRPDGPAEAPSAARGARRVTMRAWSLLMVVAMAVAISACAEPYAQLLGTWGEAPAADSTISTHSVAAPRGTLEQSLAASGAASADPALLESFTTRLDTRVVELMETYDVPGVALALVTGGEVVWSGAHGFADVNDRRPMTVDSINRAESISKSVTAWGVVRLAEEGLISLDDPVTQYLSRWRPVATGHSETDITVRHLLGHNAGMALGSIGVHYPPGGEIPTLEEDLAAEARVVREPGSGFQYSNTGYNLLELVIEEVTGQDYAIYMDETVLDPLGMTDSTFGWQVGLTGLVPNGYDTAGAPVPPYVYPARASGGLLAPVEDIARFVAAGMIGDHYRDRGVLGEESIRQLYTPVVETSGIYGLVSESYGFGHFLETLSNGRQAIWHGGQGSGWMTHFHSIPESGEGIVILTNSQRSWPLIAHILDEWAGWIGVDPVGFSIILSATTWVWSAIIIVLIVAAMQLGRVTVGLVGRRRRFVPLAVESRAWRAGEAGLAAALTGVLIWAQTRDYLFVTSVFPTAAPWLGWSIVAVVVVSSLSAIAPPMEPSIPSRAAKTEGLTGTDQVARQAGP